MQDLEMNPDSKKASWALLRDYNAIAAELGLPDVKKFSDRATGLKRLTAMREKLAQAAPSSTPETQLTSETETAAFTTTVDPILDTQAPATEQPAAVPAAVPTAKRGRSNKCSGMSLRPTATCAYGNPRREGSCGHKSLQIIIDNPGILVEDFIRLGGRSNDLRWDLGHGNATAEASAG